MIGTIEKLKDKDNNYMYPLTVGDAVIMDDNRPISEHLKDIAYFANVKNDPSVDSGVILNTLINQVVTGRIIINGDIYIGTQVQVKKGITLDFIDSTVKPMSSIDLFYLAPGGKINNLTVDTRGKTYTSKVLTLDPSIANENYFTETLTEYSIKGLGDNGLGTLVYYHQNNTTANKYLWITFVKAKVQAYGFNKQIDIHSEAAIQNGTGGWINGNIFDVILEGGTTAIHLHGNGDILSNICNGQIQSKVGWTQRGLYIENGAHNKFNGMIWDVENFSTSAVEWASTAYFGNTVTSYIGVPTQKLVNNTVYYDNTVVSVGGGTGEIKAFNSKANKTVSIGCDNSGNGFITVNGTILATFVGSGLNMMGNSIWGFSLDNGTTAQRPTNAKPSQVYHDKTIGKVILWTGSVWVDFMGNGV